MFSYHVELISVRNINGKNKKIKEEFVVCAPNEEVAGNVAQYHSGYWGAEIKQVNIIEGIVRVAGLKQV